MSVTITSRLVSGVVIVDVSGRLCFLEVALQKHFHELLEEDHRNFVLDLADVPYIDSFGLGQLVTIWSSIRSKDGRLILLRPTDHVRHLLQITKLDTIFPIAVEELQAVRSARTSLAVVM
ncbi:MAG: anti-sigma factor antagonist [Acidobacteria bacterium]|nr:MAG: anti-sigma factor antagonist [Acidobacteriota bacterium]